MHYKIHISLYHHIYIYCIILSNTELAVKQQGFEAQLRSIVPWVFLVWSDSSDIPLILFELNFLGTHRLHRLGLFFPVISKHPKRNLAGSVWISGSGFRSESCVSSFNWNVFLFHGSPNIKGIWILYLPRTGPFISDHGTSRKIILLPSILYPILSHCTPIISHDTPHPGPIVWWLKSSPIPHHGCHPRRSACSSSGGRGPASYQHAFISVCVCISVDHVYIYILYHVYMHTDIYT